MGREKYFQMMVQDAIAIGMESVDKQKNGGACRTINGKSYSHNVLKEGHRTFLIQKNGEWYPHPMIVEIGLTLHQLGGIEEMRRAYDVIREPFQGVRFDLSTAWHLVGDWKH